LVNGGVVKAKERVGALRRDAITTAGVPGQPVFADGFGWYLDYRQAGGRGGRPLLESPGPDGFFDRLTDNIYSDRR
jgi:hypothetical protein